MYLMIFESVQAVCYLHLVLSLLASLVKMQMIEL